MNTTAPASDIKTLDVVLRQFEDTLNIQDVLDCSLAPSNSLIVVRTRSNELYLFDISGAQGGHLVSGFECEQVASYAWVSLGTTTQAQLAQSIALTNSTSSLVPAPLSPFSLALVAVDSADKRIHFYNYNFKNEGLPKRLTLVKNKGNSEPPFICKFVVDSPGDIDGVQDTVSFDTLSKMACTVGSVVQCTSVEIVGSSAPGTLVLLVNKKEAFVVFFELGNQGPTSIRLGLRFPLFDSSETIAIANLVCEGAWLFALARDTGYIYIWNYTSGKKHAVVNASLFCKITQNGEEQREFKHLAVDSHLGCVAFSDSTSVYTFHLDSYFQAHPAFANPDAIHPQHKPTFYPMLAAKTEDSDEDDSGEEEEEVEEEVEEEIHVVKNFPHWFEVSPDTFPMISHVQQTGIFRDWAPAHLNPVAFNGFKSKVASRSTQPRETTDESVNMSFSGYSNQGSMNFSSLSSRDLSSSFSQGSFLNSYMNQASVGSLGTSVSTPSYASMMNQAAPSSSVPANQGSMNFTQNQGSMNFGNQLQNNQGSMTFTAANTGEWGTKRRVGSDNYSALDAVLNDGNLVEPQTQQVQAAAPPLADNPSSFFVIVPALVSTGVNRIFITPTSVLVVVKQASLGVDEEAGLKVLLLSKRTGEISTFVSPQPASLLLQRDHAAYYLSSKSLFTVVEGQSQQDLLHNAIMFQGAAAADQLCALNGWDRRSLRMHAVVLGLRYRQLDVVEPALRSLDADQQLPAAAQLREFLGGAVSMDKVFVEQLLLIAMNFMSLVIKDRAEKVHTESVKEELGTKAEEGWWQVGGSGQSGPLAELLTFTNSLETLREAYHAQQAKKPSMNITVKPRSGSNAKQPKALFDLSASKLPPLSLELDAAPLPPGVASFEHWNGMDENEIAREALLYGGGKISLAISYLRSRREMSSVSLEDPQELTFEQFKQIGYCLVYQLICHDQVEQAVKMLRNMGEKVTTHLEEIAFNTSRRSVRATLIPLLRVSDEMRKVIEFSQLLEALYPGTWYSREFTKAAMKNLPLGKSTWVNEGPTDGGYASPPVGFGYHRATRERHSIQSGGPEEAEEDDDEEEPLPQDLDDIMPNAEQKFNFHILSPTSASISQPNLHAHVHKQPRKGGSFYSNEPIVEKNKITIQAPAHSSSSVGSLAHTVPMKGETPNFHHTGYSHFTLYWVAQWDQETRERILIDKQYKMSERSIWSLLMYHVAHNNRRQIVAWVKALPKEVVELLLEETSIIPQTATFSENGADTGRNLRRALSKATIFIRETIFTELSKQKIFMPNLEAECDPSVTLLEAFLNRLARSQLLFQHIPHAAPLDTILPTANLSPFHHFFVRYCAQNQLPLVLNAYLESYKLGNTRVSADALWDALVAPTQLNQSSTWTPATHLPPNPDWVRLMLLLRCREGSSIFEASLLQAKSLLKTTHTPTINDMLRSNQLLMALSTLCYAPVPLEEVLKSSPNNPWHVDESLLMNSLQRYPTLRSALFPSKVDLTEITAAQFCVPHSRDIYTSKKDMSLKDLLDSTSPFFLDYLFGTKSEKKELLSTFPEIPDFTHPRFLSAAEVDSLDVFYYLGKGRPARAYQLLVEAVNGNANHPLKLTPKQQLILQFELRNFALRHKDQERTAAACVTLCILCNIDPVLVRVDFDALVRVSDFLTKFGIALQIDGATDPLELFLGFYSQPSDLRDTSVSERIAQTLNLLEQATPLTQPTPSDANGLTQGPWELVSQFCKVHNLPLSPSHLIYLAQSNDWVRLLYEAQEQEFGAEQVYAVIKEHYKDPNLRDHLCIVVGSMMATPPKTTHVRTREEEVDILQIVYAAHKKSHPGKTLLLQSYYSMKPLLAIVAACYDDVKSIDCLMQWLCSKCDTQLANIHNHGVVTVGGFESFDIYEDATEAASSQEWRGWHLEHLSSAIIKLFNQRNYQPLIKGFSYFDANNPILHFLQFASAASQYRYTEAETYISSFVNSLHSEKSNVYRIGSSAWAQAQAQSLTELILDQAPTDYEQSHLLSLVHSASLSPSLTRLHITFSLLRRTSLPRELLRAPPSTIISKLLDNGLYDEARHYAADNELDTEDITLREVQGLVSHYRQSCLWDIEQERMNLWSKCQQSFMEHKINPEIAGDFFYNLGTSPEKATSEKMVLLSFALGWYSGIYTNQSHPSPSMVSVPTAESALSFAGKYSSSTAIKPVIFLQELENQVLLMSLGVSMEGGDIVSSPVSSPPGSPVPTPRRMLLEAASLGNSSDGREMGLEIIVGRLINSGNVQKAEEICKQFNYKPRDFELVKTVTSIAERSTDCNIAFFPPNVASILQQRFPGQDFANVKNEIEMMEMLSSCCTTAHQYCKQVIVKCRVAQALSLTYNQVRGKSEYEILEYLVRKGKDSFRLSRSFIQACHLDSSKIATMLGDLYFRAIVDHFAKLINNETAAKLEKVEGGVDANWSSEDFTEYADLSRDPYNVGQRLLELTGLSTTIPTPSGPPSYNSSLLDTEVELLVRAHQCFVFSCSLQGSTLVLNVVKSRVKEYVKAGEFKLLVRLITGMQCYQELVYLLDFLLAYDRFELLLRKRINNDEGQQALRLALHSYLLKQAPEHQDKLEMLFLRFNMHREIADSLETKARTLMGSLEKSKPTMAIRADVLQAMQWYLDAADNYVKERAYKTANQCFSMASLLGLQARMPDTRMINLKPPEARQLLMHCSSLRDANTVATAYELNRLPEWVGPLYHQTIVNGNLAFLDDFVASVPGHSAVFPEIIKRFKADSANKNSHRVALLKQLLARIEDRVMRYDLAKEMQYEDVAQGAAAATGFEYYGRDIKSSPGKK